ncbi:MAG: bifunctional UDP-N-acetylmuramoyl-tripeptide:D-alanyl-D-alanine ligase/alanine racemase [Prevotella sp.]|uniref:bifunctional UDP-N-acetylmuramoyl-tripeptide:D-alanyl-D-alanine ligase/alanine racemase n=1 Tax=Prevotella sp. P5-92 TaxID=2024222 RepID=UPI000B97C2CB|nr:bifunctional UDP-N-acetylmuramoyl-tripeptide:D-alanyl-D-alanine ligase/alanine racemase [Prevotella sp. P5-92]MDD6818980.1 bifunctional UDP-N-acetylmuramoyl-tripeptide:D-alanyl-D-alanine ligase/alanine racemase [Prevotella sp.]MDY4654498.1 bifunctional UDP-N-acetylmuramoyl-tripeptide:D-alanyl-D-alanine ligase/alanine racemase [Prevotella sp.]OYP57566.1 bifunctional UDP-N-acetylmuramoyl-tripeptide:D-alanyl-D-alanine ligase/alanine racemase [Prevotella sp. P5-92]
MKYTIEKITTLIGARRIGHNDANIGWILTDSRSLCFPEETLFFAIRTQRNDGHNYIPELYRRGVRNFVVEQVPSGAGNELAEANFLKVTSTLAALQRLAERHRDEFDIPVVGITGSNGKTMVKEWLYQLLSPQMVVTRSPKSYNSQIGVPLSVWLLEKNTDIALFEAGISQTGEMQALRDIIQPSIGILTSIGQAHQENFRTMDEKCQEKLLLFHDAKTVIYNSDDEIVSRSMRRSGFGGKKIAWSKEDPQATLYIKEVETKDNITRVAYVFNQTTEGTYHLPFIDEASVECSLACAATALHLGIDPETLDIRMSQLEPVAMRLEVKEGQHGCTLINDSYNSDLSSLDIALDFMSRRPDHNGRKRTLILSDIQQSGQKPDKLYSIVSELAEKRGVDKFIGIGSVIAEHKDRISITEKHFFADVPTFISSETFHALSDEVILLKGARQFGFDHITELLEQKVHETILEVNLNAVVANLNHYRSFMRPETKIICMVKADAYGAGAVEVAKTLQDHRVDYLAVAVADEGVTLRKNGITSNIIIMNPEMTAFKTMFDYDLEPEVYSFRIMDALIKAAEKEGITSFPVHIKLDTGMHRLGFDPEHDIDEVIERLHHQNAIIPRSVFSHFVGSDSNDFDRFSAHQFELFDKASTKLQEAFDHKILRHICNSAGIEHFPERQLDACRLGLGLYGIDSRDNHILNTVSTLKTTILQLRHVPKEETVGYSRKGILTRDSVIAAIPIGYADGLNRHLGRGHAYCLVGGKKAPYVGNICMDVAMIDVTDIDCKEGDTVEIFGEHLPVTVLSDILDTIPYEVLTGISNRVKKVYFQD